MNSNKVMIIRDLMVLILSLLAPQAFGSTIAAKAPAQT
jgi:hypothetical protein